MKTAFSFLILLCIPAFLGNTLLAQHCAGVTAAPYAVRYSLPDGTSIMVKGKGSGYLHYMQTEDNYTLLPNTSGFPEYAIQGDDGKLPAPGYKQSSSEWNFFSARYCPSLIF